jgi:hypothetical protein
MTGHFERKHGMLHWVFFTAVAAATVVSVLRSQGRGDGPGQDGG